MLEHELAATALAQRLGAQWRRFEIVGKFGLTIRSHSVEGFVLGQWGCQEDANGWSITHLPTGAALPFRFSNGMDGLCVLAEVCALANDWVLTGTELIERYGSQIVEICRKFCGEVADGPRVKAAEIMANGYGGVIGHA